MHFSISATSLLVALSLTAPTMASRPWFCELSKDGAVLQTPFCCDGFIPARDSKVSFEGINCTSLLSCFCHCGICPARCKQIRVFGLVPDANEAFLCIGVDVSKQNPFKFECPKGGQPRCCHSAVSIPAL